MTIDAATTVRELAVELKGATRIFEKLGIDYCCAGEQSLQEACTRAGVKVEDVASSLRQAEQISTERGVRDWQKENLAELVEHIIEKHHTFVRRELTRLKPLLDKVCSVHGQNHAELNIMQRSFEGLNQELSLHMQKEELVLFPFIVRMEQADNQRQPVAPPPFGTVENPIGMMESEHDRAGNLLREIRKASSDYSVPPDGCASYQTLYEGLQAFEQDLHEHIHLENNILFPRAIDMESRLRRQPSPVW